jgi:hypothetical protein
MNSTPISSTPRKTSTPCANSSRLRAGRNSYKSTSATRAQDVEVYVALTEDQAKGFAVVASEPRKFTILNIVGSIDLDQLAKLQHHVDLHVDLDDALDVDASDIAP